MKNKNIKMIVGAIAGVLLIAGVMFFVFKDNGSNQVVEAPVAEEQVIEENTNQFAQDIIMRAQEEAEAEPEEVEIEEVAEEEQTSIVASQDEELPDDVIVISKDASPAEIVDAVKENITKKEASGGTGTTGTQKPATQPSEQPATNTELSVEDQWAAMGFEYSEIPNGGEGESFGGAAAGYRVE